MKVTDNVVILIGPITYKSSIVTLSCLYHALQRSTTKWMGSILIRLMYGVCLIGCLRNCCCC